MRATSEVVVSRWPALLGVLLGLLAIGPGLGPGFILIGDMVFVPDPEISRFTLGLDGTTPRHVPSDTVVTLLSQVIPAQIVQKIILLTIFVVGCAGAARLVQSHTASTAAGLVAGAFYVWNPYVAERLLIGHWALLLGYAGLPWVVGAAVDGRLRGLLAALVPAAVGGFAAMLITLLTLVPVAALAPSPGRLRRAGTAVACWTVLSLPWLIPALTMRVVSDPAGVGAFAVRADTPLGELGSVLGLGGIWNADAVPTGYDHPAGAVARLALTLTGVVALLWIGSARSPRFNGVAVAAGAGLAIAWATAFEPGREVLRQAIAVWGGFAVLRDAQQYVAPLALVAAAGLGLLAGRLRREAVIVGVLAPLAVLPTLAWGAFGRLAPVDYPDSWTRAERVMGGDGDVVVLPFEAYRRYPWNHGRPSLDPAQRFFAARGRRVVINDSLVVDEERIAAEDPRTEQVARILRRGEAAERLCAAGFGYAVADAELPAERRRIDGLLEGADPLLRSEEITVYGLCPR